MVINIEEYYMINPKRKYHSCGEDRIRVSVPHCSKSVEGTTALGILLDQLASEEPLSSRVLSDRLPSDIINSLIKYFVLLPSSYSDALSGGLCTPSVKSVGEFLSSHDLDCLMKDDVVLIHAPIVTNSSVAATVASGGQWIRSSLAGTLRHPLSENAPPGLLVDLDFGEQLKASDLRLFDLGNICFNSLNDSIAIMGQRLTYLCRYVVSQGARPLLLGGDHSLAFYSIEALSSAYQRVGVLQFDAHPDLYTIGADCDTSINHANVFHWIRKMDHVKSIWQVGIRDMYHQSTSGLINSHDSKISSISSFEIATKGYVRLLKEIDKSIPWFISFDVDVLAGIDTPQTATPVLGGLNYYPLLQLFENLFECLNIVGMEFIEIGDELPTAHGPSAIASRLISRFLFHLRKASPCTGNVFSTEQMITSDLACKSSKHK